MFSTPPYEPRTTTRTPVHHHTDATPGRARKKKKKVILSGRRTRGARERNSAQSFAVLLEEVLDNDVDDVDVVDDDDLVCRG